MKNINLRVLLAAVCVMSILTAFSKGVSAGPIRFDQVTQIVDARPAEAQSSTFSSLVVSSGFSNPLLPDDDETKKPQQQDDRVITTTKSDIVKDDECDCVEEEHHRGF